MSESFEPPIAFGHVLDDPALVRRLVEQNGPYSPVQRYFQNAAEYRALSGSDRACVTRSLRRPYRSASVMTGP